jgi:broad specificity phosphatase PhoE
MSKLVARHGFSDANDRELYGTPAFGNPESPLAPRGREQAAELGGVLALQFGIEVAKEPAAVSRMRRSQETATVAGFQTLTVYPELDEEKGGLSDSEIIEVLRTKSPPEATREAAIYLIEHPPVETVWVTHALLIATMCRELGIYGSARFTPKFCEVRELPL